MDKTSLNDTRPIPYSKLQALLQILAEDDGVIQPYQVYVQKLGVKKPRVSNTFAWLERNGYIKVIPKHVELQDKGESLLKKSHEFQTKRQNIRAGTS